MVSGAGGAAARRRRDLTSSFLLFSFLFVNLPKNPNLSSSGFIYYNRHLCNGEREQCFLISLNQTSPTNLSLNLTTELLHQSNDIFGQTSEQYFDDTSNDSRSGPSMDVVTIPLPPPSTLTPAPPPPSPARRSMPSTMTPAFPPCLTLPSTMNPANPPCLTPASRHASTISSSANAKLGFPLEGLAFKTGPSTSPRPRPIICAPIINETKPRSVKSPLFLLSISNQCLGRILILKCRRHHLRQNSPSLLLVFNHSLRTLGLTSNMAMSFVSKSLKIYGLSFPNQYCRRSEYGQVSMTNVPNQKEVSSAEEDWKAQVDSKKILAQPHQSATANLSRQGEAQVTEPSTAPLNLKGITEDILSIANLFQNLSFRLIPRSENIIVDDFAKKAIWSMTSGPFMFYVTLYFI